MNIDPALPGVHQTKIFAQSYKDKEQRLLTVPEFMRAKAAKKHIFVHNTRDSNILSF